MSRFRWPRELKSIGLATVGFVFLTTLIAFANGLLGDQEKPREPEVKRIATKTSGRGGSSETGKSLSPGEYESIKMRKQQGDEPAKISGASGSVEKKPMRSSVGGGGRKAKPTAKKRTDPGEPIKKSGI